MNKLLKMVLAGAAIIAVSAAAHARGGEDCGFDGRGPMMGGMNTERMEKMREEHLATLHSKLKLTAQQESAWKQFAANNPMADKIARLDPAEMEKLNAPQRMEKGLEHMKTMEAKMSEHLVALKAFYAVLTPEQQKIFDAQMPRHGMRDGKRGK